MVPLIRKSLSTTIQNVSSSHAGLLLTHALPVPEKQEREEWKKLGKSEKDFVSKKSTLIKTITGVKPCSLYEKAFNRWLSVASKVEQFGHLTGTLSARMMIGLSTGGAMETGVLTQHSYGMPMIPGSSVKGAVRHYADSLGLDKQYLAVLFGADDKLASQSGMAEGAGYLVWHDAWWIPEGNSKPFIGEVVTVHHQEYYGGNGEATDFDSPVPNQQLAVQGSFYFVIEGEPAWVALAIKLLRETIELQGLGAKRAAGYGFLKENLEVQNKLNKNRLEAAAKLEKTKIEEALKTAAKDLNENQNVIQEFKFKLLSGTNWQNANPGSDLMNFGTLYKMVEGWENAEDIKFAITMFEENIPKWLKNPLKDNKTWKDRINALKRKAGLL